MAGNTKAHCIHTSFPFILLECLDAKKSTEFTNEQMRLSPIKKKKKHSACPVPTRSPNSLPNTASSNTSLLLGPQYSRMLFQHHPSDPGKHLITI